MFGDLHLLEFGRSPVNTVFSSPVVVTRLEPDIGPRHTPRRSVLALFLALIPMLPGLLFGGLLLLFMPINLLEGRGSWLAAYPVPYTLSQIATIVAWLRSTRRLAGIAFISWSSVTIVCSVVLIAELQRQINAFDEACGNLLLGPIFMQISACGTILGILLLAFCANKNSRR